MIHSCPPASAEFDSYRLRVYCSVVEHGSFTRAAEDMLLSQPAVSAHVRALERAFRVQLLDRSHRHVVPTEAGEAVYSLACEILQRTKETADLVVEFQAGSRGRLNLGATTGTGSYILPELLSSFREAHPGARVRLWTGTRSRVLEEVISGEIEFGYVERGPLPKGLGAQPMRSEDLVFFSAPGQRLARAGTVRARDIRDEELVTAVSGMSYLTDAIMSQLHELGMTTAPAMEVAGPEAIKRIVTRTAGVGLLPRSWVAAELDRGELVELRLAGAAVRVSYELAYRARPYRSPLSLAFLAFMVAGSSARCSLFQATSSLW